MRVYEDVNSSIADRIDKGQIDASKTDALQKDATDSDDSQLVPFVKLRSPKFFFVRDNYELDTLRLEKEMKKYNGGLLLEGLEKAQVNGHEAYARNFVPYFSSDLTFNTKKLIKKFEDVKGSTAMSIKSNEELINHMLVAYQVAHFHYIIGKKYYENFPHKYCGFSSANVAFSLMNFGYVNSTFAYSTDADHAYVLLPFIYEKGSLSGSILIDPTSDQLWAQKNGKRNSVIIKLGEKWSYTTDWQRGKSLYPDLVSSICELKEEAYHDTNLLPLRPIDSYFSEAFSNPIKIRAPILDE